MRSVLVPAILVSLLVSGCTYAPEAPQSTSTEATPRPEVNLSDPNVTVISRGYVCQGGMYGNDCTRIILDISYFGISDLEIKKRDWTLVSEERIVRTVAGYWGPSTVATGATLEVCLHASHDRDDPAQHLRFRAGDALESRVPMPDPATWDDQYVQPHGAQDRRATCEGWGNR